MTQQQIFAQAQAQSRLTGTSAPNSRGATPQPQQQRSRSQNGNNSDTLDSNFYGGSNSDSIYLTDGTQQSNNFAPPSSLDSYYASRGVNPAEMQLYNQQGVHRGAAPITPGMTIQQQRIYQSTPDMYYQASPPAPMQPINMNVSPMGMSTMNMSQYMSPAQQQTLMSRSMSFNTNNGRTSGGIAAGGVGFDDSYRMLRNITHDERAFRIGVLISQQEATYGTNMYQSISSLDSTEMTNLIARGYNEDEAALIIFERKFGNTPPPAVR